MQIHIINLKYLVNEDKVASIRPLHREFLDIGYDKGILLASGPKSDKTGGIILAKGDIEDVKKFIENDPFYTNNIAQYSFNTFDAVKHIKELTN
ncbi:MULTISPECIES: YciI family protein [Francisella]|uniref:YCII-related protein n=1 Tax=Francisella orientalis TaxID=299583 RepID=A0AAP6X7D9_9GAMM|nr:MULTISPECIES: YciI family protein [Francisella]AFJ43379.1 YCII-related protein [Francisella orientalis str. Toba 04]AHB98703.1 hypothetical protein M973_07705 [Francisella orientalis LADL 07-285A]AKN85956.1 YCII-related protein [Francisella orientalis FNO12]AKN87495.1 YCII-related protein [Francisella orientalis FNO24]AKN89032.1 YCII-related protein [Francisella orientalis]